MADAVSRSLAHLVLGNNSPRSCCLQSQSFCKGLLAILIVASFFHVTFSSQPCFFNRTYSIPSALDMGGFIDSRRDPVEIPFDDDEFSLGENVSPFIQESAIVSTTLIISIPVPIATETFGVLVNCSGRDPSREMTDSADYVTGHFSCVEICNRTLDLTSLNHVSPSGLECTISTNETSAIFNVTENSKVLVTLKLVVQDLVREADPCPPGQFQCNDGRCFDVTRLCDAIPDCVHGDDESVCDEYPLGSICNFERGMCGWRPSKEYWIRHKGPTRTRLTGPDVDHTLSTSNGYYVYTEASDMVSSKDFTALLISPLFQPASSAEDGSMDCQVTFYYHFYGNRIDTLSLYAIEEDNEEASRLHYIRKGGEDVNWEKVTVPIEKTFTKRYFLQFEGSIKPFGSSRKGDIAIDDISMSAGCFNIDIDNRIIDTFHQCRVGNLMSTMYPSDITSDITSVVTADLSDTTTYQEKLERYGIGVSKKLTSTSSPNADRVQLARKNVTRFLFTNCGQTGPTGPTQQQCDLYYLHSNVTVRVYEGLQEWLVPQSGLYKITAIGAIGGSGAENPGPSGGASVGAVVSLSVGSKLVILVGQAGHSACSERSFRLPGVKDICEGKYPEKEKKRLGTITAGGGGGGGGGSFVALLQSGRSLSDPGSWEQILVPLVIAGGGGGLAFSRPADDHLTSHGIFSPTNSGTGTSGGSQGNSTNLPGAGGGWYGDDDSKTNGKSLVSGGGGGNGCQRAKYEFEWEVPGGFGGGGGGCTAGGGGGGYTGGYVSLVDNITGNGRGGLSFVTNLSYSPPTGESGVNLAGHGKVLIELVIMCPDETFVPIYVGANGCNSQLIPVWCWIVIVVSLVAMVALLVVVLWCRVFSRRTEEDRLRNELALLRKNVMSEINPLYGARKSIKEEDFPELPRASLKLLHPLGNGAFGEVYKGAYFPSKEKNESICVAIKTLSKDATDEHKNDFLMEAVLLGSLKHYNIVKLVGVSFIRVPKFLVLEFMEGGDLKTFLQANRPTFEHKTTLKITDLLRIAMDVADGCKYLESLKFIHRDLAARNILLTTRGPGRVAKIGDFGMAKDVYKSEYYRKSKNSLVPVKWMPPEAYLDGVFSTKTDVWSFGVLLWEILTFAYIPYPGLSNHEVIQCVAKGDRMCPPRYCPKALKALIESCWRTSPDQRPTFEHLCVLLARLSESRDVTSTSIPSHGIEVDRCLVSAYSYESDQETCETNPMLPSAIYPPANHFSTDSEGYLQAAFSDKKERKTSVRLDSLEEDFPKSVQMNIYDSDVPTSASIIEDDVNANSSALLNHEYSFPPVSATAPKATAERSESLV